MKIDSHQHFWKFDPVRDAWIDETMSVIRKDFLPADLKPVLETNHIDGCIAVQADQSEEETWFLLDCAAANPFVKGVVGWLDLMSADIEEKLAQFSENTLLKGLRHIVQAESNDFMLRADFQNGISYLKQFGMTYDILVFPPQLPAAIELVNKFPDQKFVVDHIAKPYIKDGKIDAWKSHMQELAQASNVYCKVSGMTTEADWNNWTKQDFRPYLDVIFEAFGIERIMYGSDWPVCLLAASYKEQLDILEDYLVSFSEQEKHLVMGGNATSFYNLSMKG